ncbi:efflux RND transporter periplasmic adaptor subunit [Gilvimarinus polysaccharolyticus]|uniref:efflux RND transporter periplasmic adaptor subunit n=1 Tax=Gilvimarinus polysaccharolyticus TaxID=863921 RepID=UPI000673B2C2|nr:efflux RND transporter periplasmic adaptor subunit [Gilvimarinus polysaccharolyticus]
MRIIVGVIIAVLCTALVVGIQKWRGPVVSGLAVELMPLELRVVASGEVRYQSLAHIGSEITGTVIARHVIEGDWVNSGDLLIELNPSELQSRLDQAKTQLQQLHKVSRPQAQAALAEAQDNLSQANREASRREALAAEGLIAAEQVEQAQRLKLNTQTALTRAQLSAEALAAGSTEEQLLQQRVASAEAELAKTRIYAPFTGRVQTRNVEPGDLVQPGKVLLEIARSDGLDRYGTPGDGLEVVVALDEKNFAPLQLQQQVQLIADAWPEQTVPGVVSFIAPVVDSGRGTIDIHISVLGDAADQRSKLLNGMTVSANIMVADRERTLVLPNDYLQVNASGKPQVLHWSNGTVKPVEVQLGLRNMTHSEITTGLAQGDIVLQTEGLNKGQRVRVRLEQPPYVIR